MPKTKSYLLTIERAVRSYATIEVYAQSEEQALERFNDGLYAREIGDEEFKHDEWVSDTVIEVKEDKLMLTRHGDFITLAGKFPRLTKKDAKARLKEIKKLLLAL